MSHPPDIRRFPMFAALSDADVEKMQGAVSTTTLRAGTTIFQAGEPVRGFYMVAEGGVKVYRLSPSGQEQILSVMTEGQTFAEAAVFMGSRYPASAQCVEDSVLLFVERQALLTQLSHDPSLGLRMLAAMATKLHKLVGLVEDLTLRDARGRLCRYVLGFVPEGEQGPCIVKLPASNALLSRLLGVTGETFSRTLKQLKTEGIVEAAGRARFQVHNVERLREAAGEIDERM